MKIISIANLKGGVGKTETAINMSCVLADMGKRVLIVDNDIQCNTSKFFELIGMKPSIVEVFQSSGDKEILQAAIKNTKNKNLSILPSTMDLAAVNIEMAKNGEVTILHDCLRELENDFDYIIIDNAPNMTPNVINAIIASNDIIVPTDIDEYGLDGLDNIREQVQIARESGLNDSIKIVGVLITKYNARTKVDRQGAEELRKCPENKLFDNMINLTVEVKKAKFNKIPLVKYARRNPAAQAYIGFVNEYLKREGE
ncbi:ParA family protein [Pelosinus sp. IPA-1]|uniref:ParA family protein n=1 Tax=Pelosinus sp. IPA-1 TaxID=3029569 RepID=UPI002436216B|nr:ParA family protein [Pelosinus sp. IPA-1]GMB01055.1 sporulation initiation inhibitor Soj [Pelosinus sp. IPA-1]